MAPDLRLASGQVGSGMGPPAGESSTSDIFDGGGQAGALMRQVDWSATPVGAPETWPASLRTTIGILLRSRHPMFLWWGPELVQFYNDAYTPSFGEGKHPTAMGQRGVDCWLEIWPIIWPQIDDVMSRGRASWNEDQLVPIFRNGRIEEVYWTYGYSPVPDDAGGVGGTLVVCTETTNRVLASRRLESLRALSEAASNAPDAMALVTRTMDALEGAVSDVPFALLYLTEFHAVQGRYARAVGVSEGDARQLDAAVRARLAELSSSETPDAMPAGVTVLASTWGEKIEHIRVLPIDAGTQRPVGWLVVGLSPRLPCNDTYARYLQQLADLVGQGVARIEAFRIRALVEGERNQLLEQAPVATALLTGPTHVFRLANPMFREMVGRDEIVGRAYLDVFPELRDTPLAGTLDRVYATGEPFVTNEMLVPIARRSGTPEERYFRFNLEPIRHEAGHIDGMMAIAVDITTEVLARKALERAHREREQLLSDLESASRAKDEFLAMLGHELRNPLSPILTALQLMKLRGVQGADRERAIIERQVRHVVGLVDDLLDVSRITRGQIELKRERVRISEVVAKSIEQASPLIDQRSHRLRVDLPPDLFVEGDASRLAQVVANLLTNAAKYTERGGSIEINARAERATVVVQVSDNGIGIAPDVLPHVFDAFTQERQLSDRSMGGLGLGLAIVKNLVTAHDGTVEMQSAGKGLGARVIVRLPLAPSEEPSQEAIENDAQDLATVCRVLLVDDNEDAAVLLGESLRTLGYQVQVVFDPSDALTLASDYLPDVALLDLGLPVMDGYELAARLRQREGWQRVRFAALTGYGQEHDAHRTRAAGFEVHLVKPIDLLEVDNALRRLTESPQDRA